MDLHVADWLNLLVRWAHLIAGISWIGSSFYFMWLDANLTLPEGDKKDVEGELWMVHSGGFYQVERRRIGPGSMPKVLHWFKYEALFTLISGLFLLGIVYYGARGAYLIDPTVASLTFGKAILISVGILILSWFVYDGLWQSKLGRDYSRFTTALCLILTGFCSYFLCKVFSGRAAFIHIGAMFGSIMVVNVWVRILPAQQAMIDATKEGRTPDFALSKHAKRRSVHNSYMTFPVLFMMLSNHYGNTYGHKYNWIVLLLLIILGAGIRHVMIAKYKSGRWAALPAAAALIALILMTASRPSANASGHVAFTQVQAVVNARCVPCHAANPLDKTFGPLPAGGISFEQADRIAAFAPRIKVRAIDTKTMPFANKTGISEEERELISRWIEQGARLDD